MITIKARINLSENGGTIQSATSNNDGSKLSSSIASTVGKVNKPQIVNPFFFGLSRFSEIAYNYIAKGAKAPYFIGSQVSDSNGDFATNYTFTVSGSNIENFIITFDNTNNAYPNSITVDGKTFVDDDAVWEIVVDKANTHTITIGNWNKPNSPLIITSIYADVNIEIDRTNLLSFESDISEKSTVQNPTYGIISNSSNISFNDLTEGVLDLITKKLLHSGIATTVYLDNDIQNKQEQICFMYIQSLDYDSDNRQVNLSLKDNLEKWQDVSVEAIPYDFENPVPRTGLWFFNRLYTLTRKIGYTFEDIDDDTSNALSSVVVQYPLLEAGSLWDEWNKLCELCLLNIYVNNDGNVVVKHII